MERSENMRLFAATLRVWFRRRKRTLPWRDLKIRDDAQRAYLVLVSEVMLQQTQVPRVEGVYKRFVREFPSLRDLARATNRRVILAWRGMGYNARALRLRDAARTIEEKFGGTFPRAFDELRSIKGIGPYTAAAIRNFAFGLPTPCIDTNIRRILHRVFVGPERRDGTWGKTDKQLLNVAEQVLRVALDMLTVSRSLPWKTNLHPPAPSSTGGRGEYQKNDKHIHTPPPVEEGVGVEVWSTRDWHAALMDFGSLVCTKNSPQCAHCPLAAKGICVSAGKVSVVKKKRKKEPGREIAGKFVPNRIIRGRIVEELRDASGGLSLADIGCRVCIDWDAKVHGAWLKKLLEKLEIDGLIGVEKERYRLAN